MTFNKTTNQNIVVYQVKNLANGKLYIGITKKGLRHRRWQHLSDARRNRGYILANAIRKHGEESFSFSILKYCSTYNEAILHEIDLIEKRRPSYNLTNGGEGTVGLKMSEKCKLALREAHKNLPNHWVGRKHIEESKIKMRMAKLGKPNISALGMKRTKEAREKMRIARLKNPNTYWLGKKRSKETIEKIIATKALQPYKPPTEKAMEARRKNFQKCQESKLRKVRCIDDLTTFPSIISAAHYYNVQGANITSVCKGRHLTAGGKRFEYAGENP